MYYANAKQFQLYDSILLNKKGYQIEEMVYEAASALYKHIPKNKKMIILCGKGNNGADGMALASLIKEDVIVYYLEDPSLGNKASSYYLQIVSNLNIPIKFTLDELYKDLENSDVIIDAIFGTGFKGALNEYYLSVVNLINQFHDSKQIVSIDIPTGVICDTGDVINDAIMAHHTITFMANKIGFLNPDCHSYIGQVIVENILFHQDVFDEVGFSLLQDNTYLDCLIKKRIYFGHKGTYGKVCCNVGSSQYPGAAVLSVGAALHTGCGFVSYTGNDFVRNILIQQFPEIVYQNDYYHANAILFGCGKGWTENTKQELRALITNSEVPLLIDADGINCLSENKEILLNKKAPIIVTPHPKEMERLSKGDSVLASISFARQYNVIVVLKGASTLITDGKKHIRIASGDRAMAVAGMGDCLSGIIASLLAQGYEPFNACLLGVYIHGLCGSKLSKSNYTVLPSRLIQEIPIVMKDIEKRAND